MKNNSPTLQLLNTNTPQYDLQELPQKKRPTLWNTR